MKKSRKFMMCTLSVIMSHMLSITSAYAVPAAAENSDKIHSDATVIDTHSDTLLNILDRNTWLPAANIGDETDFMIDIPKLQEGGIDVQTFGAYTGGYAFAAGGQDFNKANSRLLALINALKWTLDKNPDTMEQMMNLKDMQKIEHDGKIAALSSIEGAYSLNKDTGIELLRQYYDLGVRMLAPTWSNSNALGEGVNNKFVDGTPSSGGLTELGRQVIREMNKLGMIVDVSHMNEETFWDTIETSEAPVIASHSCVYNIANQPRNLKDDQIKAIAEKGGVVQVNFYNLFLSDDYENVTVKNLVDHIDYIVDLVGVDYVGLGSDFDGADMPIDLQNASMVPGITRELLERGYTKSEIEKILGGNSIRLFKEVWDKAADNGNSGMAPTIVPSIAMGEIVNTETPTFTAAVNADKASKLDAHSLKAIVDGNIYTPEFDEATGTMSITIAEPLKEKFHVVTFEAANNSGKIARETRIFCIQ